MSIDAAQVGQIAHLARLAVDEQESEAHARNLSDILAFVDRLAEVDSKDVEPMAHPLEMTQRLRPDQVSEPNERERFQALAPSVSDGCYLVPRVIE
ncbi:Asp-tRNA(Asn)/Glu-tRNA(Gln) amidotransferase subunit GatC [Spiribacter sp. C176]|uniref:Aspartyl/glutamyl-tRNA(Asn/Gln) amidotransferase subunit C n=1 Tax=Spiribacter salilacus TaxID=2664894 RepID=A0A6N7R0Z8_9GAMM|nr:Asp-tRNA(Asn)/Glu-tRNA(Gln) amidotransferase subunit GatC [Spiribacter salilacus]MRH78614.1 Asp-tRNA(Asn)/Glu-tRNA(Gln) amidotransferase subunit GatC [Spiribacter salilacus]